MKINRIDHVNIRTGDIDVSVQFYIAFFGFTEKQVPAGKQFQKTTEVTGI